MGVAPIALGGGYLAAQMSNGKSSKPPPDYSGAAQQQSQASQVNMSGPFGGQQWVQGPGGGPKGEPGQMTLQSTFNGPLGQAAQNAQQQAANAGPLPTGTEAAQQAFNAYMDNAQSRLDPMFQQQEEALRTRLMNQGLDPNSAAATGAMGQFGQARNDAYSSALNNAQLQATQAGNTIFQQGLQSAQMPYQQMAMLQALQNPQFGAAAGMYQTPQALAAAIAQGNYGLTQQQLEQQNTADIMGGAMDLATAPLTLFGLGGK